MVLETSRFPHLLKHVVDGASNGLIAIAALANQYRATLLLSAAILHIPLPCSRESQTDDNHLALDCFVEYRLSSVQPLSETHHTAHNSCVTCVHVVRAGAPCET